MKPARIPWARMRDVLSTVDWPKAIHKVSVFARELRGDAELQADSERMRAHAAHTKSQLEKLGRTAVGCTGAPDCGCPFCSEAKG